MRKTTLFFLFVILLLIPLSLGHIYFGDNVSISYFNSSDYSNSLVTFLIKNETMFTSVEIWDNHIRFNEQDICITPPATVSVYTQSDVFNLICCYPNWVAYNTSCDITDHNVKYYLDSNNCVFPQIPIPVDNGTIQSCNYCSEEIFQVLGDCTVNSTQSVSYVDLNKELCCDITGIIGDCSILYPPYSEVTEQQCNTTYAYMGTLNCQQKPEMEWNDKENCIATIPTLYMGEDFKCVGLVKNTATGEIVQVTPNNMTYPVIESRNYFTPMYSKVNFYYTAQNIKPETDYTVRIECSSPQRTLYSEYKIERSYKSLDWVYFRTRWMIDNKAYIVGAIVVVMFILIVLGIIWKWAT